MRQGDPLSPILFNIVVDMFAVLIARTKAENQIEGVIPHLVDDGLSILQYADDTVIQPPKAPLQNYAKSTPLNAPPEIR